LHFNIAKYGILTQFGPGGGNALSDRFC